MQPVDFTTLMASCAELRKDWLPARLEQVYQRDRYTVALGIRTLKSRGWLNLCWHPQAAHVCMGDAPPRAPDTFTFSQQLKHQLGGLTLVSLTAIAPWERALDMQFAKRPGDPVLWHLYVEIMGKYSNVILTNQDDLVITAAHQVNTHQSSVRQIQTGQPYDRPPALTDAAPMRSESFSHWQARLTLIPDSLKRSFLKTYRGLSSNLVNSMIQAAGLDPDSSTDTLQPHDWQALFDRWQEWLQILEQENFQPGWLPTGYTVVGWGSVEFVPSVQALLNRYYTDQRNQQEFTQLRHQISQRLTTLLKKLQVKAQGFRDRLQQSDHADEDRQKADLLMAYLHEWQPGMKTISLPDFLTNKPVAIALNPEKNAVQNAQAFYKRHQKLKRSRDAIEPLLREVQSEIDYLEQVEVAIAQNDQYQTTDDLMALEEIRDELIQQRYLNAEARERRAAADPTTEFLHDRSPSGFEVLIGRNNRQNDFLTFRVANDYDLWFHAQEIPGSHVLLRLEPGSAADEADLQHTANLAAYYSRARQSEAAPVIYTASRHVYKPKGAKPGVAIYKHETVIWGKPQLVKK